MVSRGPHPFVRGLKPRRGVVRGLPVEVPAGEPFSLWGKVFDAMIIVFLCLCVFSCNDLSYARFSFFRLKRSLEQAQPSMAKRLKVGAASKVGVSYRLLRPLIADRCRERPAPSPGE